MSIEQLEALERLAKAMEDIHSDLGRILDWIEHSDVLPKAGIPPQRSGGGQEAAGASALGQVGQRED